LRKLFPYGFHEDALGSAVNVVDIIKKEEANEFLSLRDTDPASPLQPKEHRLKYGSFSFYLDLDELDEVVKKVHDFWV